MEQQVITESPVEMIKMEVHPFGTETAIAIHFQAQGTGICYSTEEEFPVLLKEELQWEDLKCESVINPYEVKTTLITPGEMKLLVSRLVGDEIERIEAQTETTCGFKLMVNINKDALKEQSPNEVIWEILKQSPLIGSARFLNYYE